MSQNNYNPNPNAMTGFPPVSNTMQQPFYSGPYNSNVLMPQYGYSYGAVQTMPQNQQPNNRMNMPQRSAISGRIVNSDNEIMPQEIPMDGSVSLFPTADYSCVYAKCWTTNGNIQTVKFVPAVEVISEAPVQEDPYAPVMKRLNDIEGMISKLLPKSANKGVRREPEVDENV